MKLKLFYHFVFLFAILSICSSCHLTLDSEESNTTLGSNTEASTNIIQNYLATGKDSCCELNWRTIGSSYCVSILNEQTKEEIDVTGKNSYSFTNLENSVFEKTNKENKVYNFTLIVKDSNNKILEQQTASATVIQKSFELVKENGETKYIGNNTFYRLLSTDQDFPQDASVKNISTQNQTDSKNNTLPQIPNMLTNPLTMPCVYNNPDFVTNLVDEGTFDYLENYKSYLEEGETIQWFTIYYTGLTVIVYGKIIKSSLENITYNDAFEINFNTAQDIKQTTEAYRVGTTITTKGFYEVDDGGKAKYIISNKADGTFGSIKTTLG